MGQICALGSGWHGAGTVSDRVLRTMWERSPRPLRHTAETGTGRSTLLFSNLSEQHVVFTKEDQGDGDSLGRVRSSPLLRPGSVTFSIGPTQLTVPRHNFAEPLDVAFIDGPHGFPFPVLEYYYLYPHIRPGGLLIVDDVHIPSIRFLMDFLSKDAMWRLDNVVDQTAFLTRTTAPTFDPLGDGWWLQGYNRRAVEGSVIQRLRGRAPVALKRVWRRIRREVGDKN